MGQILNKSLDKLSAAEEAEAEKRHRFAVRANSILAFVDCDDERRPKLREAIIEEALAKVGYRRGFRAV